MLDPVSADDLVGEALGAYRIVDRIGTGASATVYRAQPVEGGPDVALKVSHPGLLGHRTSAARFLREVQAIRRLEHPGCVTLLDWGVEEERAYIAMEIAQGEDLSEVLERESRLSQREATRIAIAVCEVLEAAHELGIVHRDLKPRNVKLPAGEDDPPVRVVDFGLAKIYRAKLSADTYDEETHQETLTSPSAVLGTPMYMAPEQVGGQAEIDGRADVYALGVIMFQMLTGRLPHEGTTTVEWIMSLATAQPFEPADLVEDIDPQLNAIVVKALESEPSQRIQTARRLRGLLTDLVDRLEGEPPTESTAVTTVMRRGTDFDVSTLRNPPRDEMVTERFGGSSLDDDTQRSHWPAVASEGASDDGGGQRETPDEDDDDEGETKVAPRGRPLVETEETITRKRRDGAARVTVQDDETITARRPDRQSDLADDGSDDEAVLEEAGASSDDGAAGVEDGDGAPDDERVEEESTVTMTTRVWRKGMSLLKRDGEPRSRTSSRGDDDSWDARLERTLVVLLLLAIAIAVLIVVAGL